MITPALQQQFAKARKSRDPRFDGRFFVAVRSTGIFCRPVCPARLPEEHNVRYFLHAQQAVEQGYRPCLRCRPDSAPGSFAWRGVQTTTQRALRILSEDLGSPVTSIAERLGISERYLATLVNREVGVSPKRYQLHSRLLLAKRLLQQSRLPIGDVALAVGFQSARSLQVNLKQHFKLTPGQLRREGKTPDNESAFTLFMPARQPYCWPQVRDFLSLRALPAIEQLDTNSYSRWLSIDNEAGWVRATYEAKRGGFNVCLHVSRPQHIQPVLTRLRRVLDVDTAPDIIHSALRDSGLGAALLTPGLRLPGVWSFFEAGCRAIIGQQISIKAAITQLQRLSDALGVKTDNAFAFPAPQAVAESDLSMLKMPGARKQALRDFASAVANQPDEELADDAVLAIKGVGPWTLQYIKLRGMSEPDMYLANDLIVARQAAKLGIDQHKAAPWRSYLTLQLWHLAGQVEGE